jgi:uncharacterized membrane-anchored protein YhcB (DUF1043 family)
MITNAILVTWSPGPPGPIEWSLIFIFLAVPIIIVALAVRFISRGNKERQKLRIELGKLADELERVRKQAEGSKKDNSSAKSG